MRISLLSILLFGTSLFFSCGKDETPEVPDEFTASFAVEINQKNYKAEGNTLFTGVSNGNYKVESSDLPITINITFKGAPEVKEYTLTGDMAADGVQLIYTENYLTPDKYSKMVQGTIKVSKWEDKVLGAHFNGKVKEVIPDYEEDNLARGFFSVKFP
ncbi:MAG: hypothetical protein KDC92_00515 [Bacteroidetes bacterium]|nr:hypothetical protein [Bacteroidota bacterium]